MAPSSSPSPSPSSPNSDRWSVDIPRGGGPPASDELASSPTGSPDKPGSTLYGNCVSVLVTCPEHLKLALAPLPGTSKSLWFPIVPVKSGDSLTESVELLLKSHFPNVITSQVTPQLIEEVRFQIAPAHAYVTVALFQCDPKPCICTHKSTLLVWLSYEDVAKCPNLAGPEIIKYAVRLQSGEQFEYDICEHSTKWTLLWALDYSEPTSEPVRVCFQNLIDAPSPSSSNLETGISCLSAHFARHCFPSLYMSYESFQEFVITSGLVLAPSLTELPAIFKAFDQEESGFLNFKQLLTGLAVMDPKVELHQNKRLRAEYLFRYYDSQQRSLVGAPKKKTDGIKQNPPKEESTTKFTELYRALSCNPNSSNTKPIPKQAFIEALESGVIKSADGLLRSSTSSIEQLLKTFSPIKPIEKKKIHRELYQLCKNVLEINPETGRDVGQFPILYDIEQTSSPSSNIEKPLPNLGEITLKKIQYFFLDPNKQPISGYLGYNPENMQDMIEDVKRLCTQAEECFSAGPRILRLDSPCYVIGDLHGNALSMACLEKIFWRMGPRMLTDNFLLLGNYVNRGPWSLECMIYLLALKLAAPKRVHLLRGNHETAHMTQDPSQDGLLGECVRKYGEKDGQVIWQSFCNVFKVMPLAAVLDNKIFCVHGGVPGPTISTIDAIEAAIPPVLTLDPQDSSSISKQLLWNDPVPATEGSQESTATDSTTGFRANSVRKTGHYFTEQAFERFLALNNLSHVIRSHQVCLAGFKCDFGGRLITVFGSVNYADTVGNKAALALVKPEGKIQIIQLV